MYKSIFKVLIVAAFVLGISKLSLAMMCGEEHSKHNKAQAEASDSQTGVQSRTTQTTEKAENVGNKICPVSAEKINEKTKATYEYKGKIYNFCCAMCIDEFKKDPEKYIKKIEEELQAQTKEEVKEETISEAPTHEGMHEGHHH